jgi:hypothetical protein
MKKIAMLLAATALAACSSEPAPEPSPSSSETEEVSEMPGNYELTMADGTKLTATINADGTYSDMDASGAVIEHGTWSEEADGQTCFTPAADSEGAKQCYSNSEPAADGTFTATPNEGEALQVKKVS